MIATIAVIAAIAEKKKTSGIAAIIYSDHMKPLSSDRSDNNRWDIKSSISATVVAAIAGVVSIWSLNFFFSAITAIVAIIWKPGLIYRNHPPFLLNCYLYALQTYRTYSSKLRLLLVYIYFSFGFQLLPSSTQWSTIRCLQTYKINCYTFAVSGCSANEQI